ncbi:MAG: cysteine--tRNA ligase [Vulcanimicrobiaceae bacterium]
MMPLRLYNTRTRSTQSFVPLRDDGVRIYVCGLTPSAQAHLGHARSFIFFDLLRRYLLHRGYRVTYVQNVTDIDDRSIAAAAETGERWDEVVAQFYASFKDSMKKLGVRDPDVEPYATRYVPQIIETIASLLERGHAYVAQDGVYYRVASFPSYGELSHRRIEELEAGARVAIDEAKDDPLDFALWKFAKPGEPSWPSPWGSGRPGWHIECSAMSRALLDPEGIGFDIHGGGADLIFPHHENEVAQSEPLMERPPMAQFWVHGGLLLRDSKKMSKSLGNFEPLAQVLDRHDPQAVRLMFLQTGYGKVMNYTEESLLAARSVLERLKASYRAAASARGPGTGGALLARIEAALDDDMNTAVALSALLDAKAREAGVEELYSALDLLGLTPDVAWEQSPIAALPPQFLERVAAELSVGPGIDLDATKPQEVLERLIALRVQARARKDWAESDRLRKALAAGGIEVHDDREGTTWSVVS